MVERLAALPGLAGIPRGQFHWLLDHGEVLHASDGAIYGGTNREQLGLFLLISGRFSVRVRQNGVEREVREILPGRPTGYLPYSRMTLGRGYLVADGPVEFLMVPLDQIRDMTRECFEFTEVCVHEMLERVRVFKAEDKHQEKMAALGRLAAGLAHELNNPASATARAARELEAARAEAAAAARALGAACLDGEALRALQSLEASIQRTVGEPMSAMDRSDLEDRIEHWLSERGLHVPLAYPLSASGLTVPDLDAAAAGLNRAQLGLALRHLAADATLRGLTSAIGSAAERIHSLVAAVKKHTNMDRAPTFEAIRLEEHLTGTVALMSSKASLKGMTLKIGVEADLPPVEGSVAELNQVWLHLIDNAIDAGRESGCVSIDARRDQDCVVVRVTDDGPGIPDEDQARVFEPFFTTKDVGQGRGLGLDIVRTVVGSHRGAVDLSSRPGHTEFRVVLPALRPGDAPS